MCLFVVSCIVQVTSSNVQDIQLHSNVIEKEEEAVVQLDTNTISGMDLFECSIFKTRA